MATNPKDSAARKLIGKFARTLLATTCLTVASSAAALAGTITYTEGAGGLPADFPNSANGTPLSAATIPGTTIVNGTVNGSDASDFFELTGLGTGTFTVGATTTSATGSVISVFDDASNLLEGGGTSQGGGAGLFSSGSPLNFGALTIPGDHNLVIEVLRYHEAASNYSVSVNTTNAVPEPSTIAGVGLGLAGALALRRKLRKQ